MIASSPVVQRPLVAVIISVLSVGLVVAVAITILPATTGSLPAVTESEDSAQSESGASLREADFDFADHELRYAGGYGLSPRAAVEVDAEFDFADHELRYAGGYTLRPRAAVARKIHSGRRR